MNTKQTLTAEYEAETDHLKITSGMNPTGLAKLVGALMELPGVQKAFIELVYAENELSEDDSVEAVEEEGAK